MSIYKFLDKEERLTKKNFHSWKEARAFAAENDLMCLTMTYATFEAAFKGKVDRLQGHFNFSRLEEMAEKAIQDNKAGAAYRAIAANDFMRRIIELPTPYIEAWLEGKNNLDWLPAYVSEEECDHLVTYAHEELKETGVTPGLQALLKNGLQGIKVFYHEKQSQEQYDKAILYWSNSLGELHHHGEYDITEEELPAELQRVYQEFDIFERFVSRCYLCETEQGYGIALVNEYDAGYADDCKLPMDKVFLSALVDAAAICARPEFPKAEVFLGESCGFEECHELSVVFPADIGKDEFQAAAKLLDELAYKAAPELMRINALLEMKVTNLDLRAATQKALKHTNIATVGELLRYSLDKLISMPMWGPVTVNDVNRALEKLIREKAVPNLRLWAKAMQKYENGQRTMKAKYLTAASAILSELHTAASKGKWIQIEQHYPGQVETKTYRFKTGFPNGLKAHSVTAWYSTDFCRDGLYLTTRELADYITNVTGGRGGRGISYSVAVVSPQPKQIQTHKTKNASLSKQIRSAAEHAQADGNTSLVSAQKRGKDRGR